MIARTGFILVCFLVSSFTVSVWAIDPDKHPEIEGFIGYMVKQHGFDAAYLHKLFSKVEYRKDIIQLIKKPGEALPWHQYRKLFVTDESVNRGIRFWRRNARALKKAEKQFGVPAEIIVAIFGVETRYGRLLGGYRVIDALTTLMLGYPRRSEFFKNELVQFLLLARESNKDPFSYIGSYAGAIGLPQFMPSSYRQYAIDFNGDKKRDLVRNRADAIGSVANFFIKHGWKTGEPVSEDVQVEGQLYTWLQNLGLKQRLSIRYLINAGIYPASTKNENILGALIVLEGDSGPIYRLGYNNFYVITNYNRSRKYAMAVYELSQRLREKYYRLKQ